jgi:predicted DNA-binding transcriptional regulator AlpA
VTKQQVLNKQKYATAAQLRERYGGRSHMWIERRLQNDPTFPRPVKLGGSLIRMWDLDEIESWERAAVTKQGRETGRAH